MRRGGDETMTASAKRLLGIAAGTLIVCVLIGLYIGVYLTSAPASASAPDFYAPATEQRPKPGSPTHAAFVRWGRKGAELV